MNICKYKPNAVIAVKSKIYDLFIWLRQNSHFFAGLLPNRKGRNKEIKRLSQFTIFVFYIITEIFIFVVHLLLKEPSRIFFYLNEMRGDQLLWTIHETPKENPWKKREKMAIS